MQAAIVVASLLAPRDAATAARVAVPKNEDDKIHIFLNSKEPAVTLISTN